MKKWPPYLTHTFLFCVNISYNILYLIGYTLSVLLSSVPIRVRQRGIQTKSVVHPKEWYSSKVTPQDIKEELVIPHKKDVPHNASTLKLTWDGHSHT